MKDIWDDVGKLGKEAGVPGLSNHEKSTGCDNLVSYLKKYKPATRIENHKKLQQELIKYINKSKSFKAESYGRNDIVVNRKIDIEIKYADSSQKLRDLEHEISEYEKKYKVIVFIYNAGINPEKINDTEKGVQKHYKGIKFVTIEKSDKKEKIEKKKQKTKRKQEDIVSILTGGQL